MATRRIGIDVGRSYTWTRGNEQIIVTALASPWAENRIEELEAALVALIDAVDAKDAKRIEGALFVGRGLTF